MTNHFGFTGYLYDRETGLYLARSRHYDPEVGRFITEDTFVGRIEEPRSFHRYSYAYDNPARYVDPTGHVVELAGDKETRDRTLAIIKLGVPKEAWDQIRVREGTGKGGLAKGHYYIDPGVIQSPEAKALAENNENLGRLQAVVVSEKRSYVSVVARDTEVMEPTHRPASL